MNDIDGQSASKSQIGDEGTSGQYNKLNNTTIELADAVLSVNKESEYYKMNHPRRGVAVIFNHENFEDGKNKRTGSSIDVDMLKNCLGSTFRFDVKVFNDLSLVEIKEEIKKVAQMNHSDADCIVVVLLTHGENDKIKAYDTNYNAQSEIFNKFTAENCPSLAGKPKIFIMQTCRGTRADLGIRLRSRKLLRIKYQSAVGEQLKEEDNLHPLPYEIPLLADFIYIYATSSEHIAFRNTKNGSYFIKVLCEELKKMYLTDHLTDILIKVNRRVATEFTSSSDISPYNNKRQMPLFECSLTRKIHFGYNSNTYSNINSVINDNNCKFIRRKSF